MRPKFLAVLKSWASAVELGEDAALVGHPKAKQQPSNSHTHMRKNILLLFCNFSIALTEQAKKKIIQVSDVTIEAE